MSDFIGILETQLDNNKLEIDKEKKIIEEANLRLKTLGERRRNYLLTLLKELEAENLTDKMREIEKNENEYLTINRGGNLKSSDFLVEFVKSQRDRGAAPADIIEAFFRSGRTMKKNSIYTLIMRLKQSDQIIEKNGKYYAENS